MASSSQFIISLWSILGFSGVSEKNDDIAAEITKVTRKHAPHKALKEKPS